MFEHVGLYCVISQTAVACAAAAFFSSGTTGTTCINSARRGLLTVDRHAQYACMPCSCVHTHLHSHTRKHVHVNEHTYAHYAAAWSSAPYCGGHAVTESCMTMMVLMMTTTAMTTTMTTAMMATTMRHTPTPTGGRPQAAGPQGRAAALRHPDRHARAQCGLAVGRDDHPLPLPRPECERGPGVRVHGQQTHNGAHVQGAV